jgi:hypothetical protein
MSITINHQTESISATSGSLKVDALRIDASGNLLVGTTVDYGKITVVEALSGGQITVGTTTADSTTKFGGVTGIHYTSAEERVAIINAESNPSETNLRIGGGLGEYNAATNIRFNTAANITTTTGSERMRIDSSGNVGIGTSNPASPLHVASTYAIITASGTTGWSGLNVSKTNGDLVIGLDNGATFGQADGSAIIRNASGKGLYYYNGTTQRMAIDSSGNLLVGTTSQLGAVTARGVFSSGSNLLALQAGNGNVGAYMTNASGTGNWQPFSFCNNGTSFSQIGSITTTASATAYNTSSDYRLKTDAQPMVGASARLQALKPVNFEWIADGTRVDGFLAHEVQAVVPEAIHGTKDEVDVDGNPVYQGIDQSKLVPLLTAALQEALTKIDALEARITALEA